MGNHCARGRIAFQRDHLFPAVTAVGWFLAVIAVNSAFPEEIHRASGRKYPAPAPASLYDDFDGHGGYRSADGSHLAVEGALSPALWSGGGEVIEADPSVVDAEEHGYVLRLAMEGQGEGSENIYLINPTDTRDFDVGTFSVDVYVPTPENVGYFAANLAVFAEFPDFQVFDDPYWAVNIGLYQDDEGELWLTWGWWDKADQRSRGGSVEADHDTWYNIRLDVQCQGDSSVMIRFYIDDRLVGSGVPAEARFLADPSRIAWGPAREIWVWRPGGSYTAQILVDNVRSEFKQYSLLSIEPDTAPQGTRMPVTLIGEDFEEGVMPFSTEWGVSFIDVKLINNKTLRATAIVDELAPPGPREIMVGLPGTAFSNVADFEIQVDPDLPPDSYAYGLYDDFDGHGAQQSNGEQMARADAPSSVLWYMPNTCPVGEYVTASEELPPDQGGDRGTILKATKDFSLGTCGRIYFSFPGEMTFTEFRSWSADFRVKSGTTSPRTGAGLDFHSAYVDGGLSWYIIFSVDGYLEQPETFNITAHINNKDRPYQWYKPLRDARLDTWYNLRFDIVIISDEEFRVDFFIDGKLMGHESPYEAPIILAARKSGGRMIDGAWAPEEERTGTYIFYMDNVYAVYNYD